MRYATIYRQVLMRIGDDHLGFIGKLVGNIIGAVFGGNQTQANPVQIPQPTVTAQQLVPKTEAPTPESPITGSNRSGMRKRISRKNLTIDTGTTNNSTNPLNL